MAMTTDPIADMLTRIRNGITARLDSVDVPASKMKRAIAGILVDEGYIRSAEVRRAEGAAQDSIRIRLKYGQNSERVISGLKRISRPGLRIYVRHDQLPVVLNGMGIAIISTSRGVMTDRQARASGTGGEVLAYVW